MFFLLFQRDTASAADRIFAQITIKLGINEPFTAIRGTRANKVGDGDVGFLRVCLLVLELINLGLDLFYLFFCLGEEFV